MMASTKTPSDEDVISLDKEVFDEADVVEVGRGLANYNSAQISRVKGLNR
jgi:glutamate 5-kinase